MDDPRVPYWGVLKYVEKLRTKIKQPERIPEFLEKNICLRVLDSGHFGPVNREDSLKESIWEMMWLDKMLIEKDNILI
jgi:protease II